MTLLKPYDSVALENENVKHQRRRRSEVMDGERQTLTIEEAAKLLGIGRQLAYDRAKTGEIPVIKIGRRLLVPRAALERLLANPKPLNLTPAANK